jgi:hypothetical protein
VTSSRISGNQHEWLLPSIAARFERGIPRNADGEQHAGPIPLPVARRHSPQRSSPTRTTSSRPMFVNNIVQHWLDVPGRYCRAYTPPLSKKLRDTSSPAIPQLRRTDPRVGRQDINTFVGNRDGARAATAWKPVRRFAPLVSILGSTCSTCLAPARGRRSTGAPTSGQT